MPPRFFTEEEIIRLFSKSSKKDIKDIMEDANNLIRMLDKEMRKKRKRPSGESGDDSYDTLTQDQKTQIKVLIAEFARSAHLPQDINTTKLDRKDVARARLIHHHMKNFSKMTSEQFDNEMEKPLRYADGTIKSLKDDFGDIDRAESDADIGVFKKGKEANLTFRGSRSLGYFLSRADATKDWLYNLLGFASTQKGTPEYQSTLSRSRKIAEEFDTHINGFSKGGGMGLSVAEDLHQEGLPTKSTVFNPHINRTHDLHNYTGEHHIIRTAGDPASITLGLTGKNQKTKLSVMGSLKYADDALREHNLANFYDDVSERSSRVKLVDELQAHKGLVDMHNELVHADNLLRDPKRLVIHAAKKFGLIAQGKRPEGVFVPEGQEMTTTREQPLTRPSFEDPRAAGRRQLTTTRDLEPQVPLRPEQRLSRPSFEDPRAAGRRQLTTTSDTRAIETFEIENLNASVQEPTNVSQAKPLTRIQKAMIGQLEEGTIARGRGKLMELLRGVRGSTEPATDRNFRLVSEALGDNNPLSSTQVQQALLEADPEAPGGLVNEETMRKFIDSNPRARKNVITQFRERVNSHANMIDEKYMTPYKRSSLAAGFGNTNSFLRTGVAGTAAGALASVAMDKLGITHDMNPDEAAFVTGSVAGAAGETAAMKAAGMIAKSSPNISSDMATSLLSKAGATRILSGGLSAGVGAVVGYEATEGIRSLFSKDADPYAKNITAEIGGGIIGTGAAVATGAAATAAAAAATGGLEAASASIEFPPLAIAFLLGSGISAIAGAVIGSQEAAAEEKQKEEMERINKIREESAKRIAKEEKAEMKADIKGAGIVALNEQYDKMIDYLKSIGASNETISKAHNDLIKALSGKIEPLTKNQYHNKMESYLNEYNLKDPTREDLQNTLETQYQVRASRMTFLINKLNQAGYEVPVPNSKAYTDTENYTAAYNEILASVPSSVVQELGLKYLPPVYQEDWKDKIVNPDNLTRLETQSVNKLQALETQRDQEEFYNAFPNLQAQEAYDNTQQNYIQQSPSLAEETASAFLYKPAAPTQAEIQAQAQRQQLATETASAFLYKPPAPTQAQTQAQTQLATQTASAFTYQPPKAQQQQDKQIRAKQQSMWSSIGAAFLGNPSNVSSNNKNKNKN